MQASEKECLVEPLYDILCLREQSDVAPHKCMIKAQPLKNVFFLCVLYYFIISNVWCICLRIFRASYFTRSNG